MSSRVTTNSGFFFGMVGNFVGFSNPKEESVCQP
jgi:hypothetical protein